MIRNKDLKSNISYTLLAAVILHAAILAFVKVELHNSKMLEALTNTFQKNSRSIKLDKIDFINQNVVEKMRRVGIKNGKKDLQRPDIKVQKPRATPPPVKLQKGSPSLSLEKLALDLPKLEMSKETILPQKAPSQIAHKFSNSPPSTENGHFYFNPKVEKVIPHSSEQDILKTQAAKNFTQPHNKAAERISNFEIRYDRPEGISEDELNSDEKAYYSFYVRSYQNYFSKIYSNYEKIVLQKPGLANLFDKKHLLIGKIDYDVNGDIVKINIIKSSEYDDLHYFFEETLKQLNQPNPPKVFTKNRKEFSIYYQLQIN